MTVYKSVPMDPGALPQQRLYLVPDLGIAPNLVISNGVPGKDGIPRKIPRWADSIAQVEWAWSPMHNRIDAYHISMDSNHSRWVLWLSCFDDSGYRWRWELVSALSTPRAGVSKKQAAIAMLEQLWREETEDIDLDQYHWINDADFLNVGEVAEIARIVWKPRSMPVNKTSEQSGEAGHWGKKS
jgi:hypothetical protein